MNRPDNMKAKLFNLTDESEWEEVGVGFPCIEKIDDKYFLKVYKEGDDSILYKHEFLQNSDMQYEQSEEKVINYSSEESNLDMAISFQDCGGAKVLWDKIKEAEDYVKSGQNDEEEQFLEYLESKVDISIPTYNNLETILKELSQLPNDRKANLSTLLSSHKIYLKKFAEIFDKAENQKDEEKLKNLCSIMKQIIQNGEHELYEILLNDTNYLNVFGILEYDTDVFQKQVVTHRQFLKNQSRFHKVVDIKDETKIEQIHFNYRLQYLKDCALGHYLDDRAINIIQIISQKIYYDLISYIANSKEILGQITDKLRNMDIKALKFLHELFSALKSFDTQKQDYVVSFHEVSAFEILIEDIFQNTKGEKKVQYSLIQRKKQIKLNSEQLKEAQLYCFEILIMSQNYFPQCLQQYTLNEHQRYQKYPFLKFLIDNIVNGEDPVRQNQCSEIFKGLITLNNDQQSSEYTIEVSRLIADNFTSNLITVFDDNKINNSEDYARILRTVLGIFIQLIKNHGLMDQVTEVEKREYLEKLSVIIEQSIKVFKLRCKYVIIKAINIYKKFCECKNEVIFQKLQITSQHILKYVFDKLGRRQNLIFSEILSLITNAHANDDQNKSQREEEDILQYRKNKNYKVIRQLLFSKVTVDQTNELTIKSKKNSECLNNFQDIDMMPLSPKSIQNVPKLSQEFQQQKNIEQSNNKRVIQSLVDYEDDEDDEDDINNGQEKLEKKIKINEIQNSSQQSQYKFPNQNLD